MNIKVCDIQEVLNAIEEEENRFMALCKQHIDAGHISLAQKDIVYLNAFRVLEIKIRKLETIKIKKENDIITLSL